MANQTERLPIYITDEFKQQLKREADEDSRALNNYILFILERRDQISEVQFIQQRLEKKK